MADTPKQSELDQFLAILHRPAVVANPNDPKEKQTYTPLGPEYSNELNAALPKVLEELKLGEKPVLSAQETVKLLSTLTSKLDSQQTAGKDGAPKDVRGSVVEAFHKARSPDGTLEIIKLQKAMEDEKFRNDLQTAQIGLIGREPAPAQQTWTFDRLFELMKLLMGGDINKLQEFIFKVDKPFTPQPLSALHGRVNMEHPAMKDLGDITGMAIEDCFWRAHNAGKDPMPPLDPAKTGENRDYSTIGPFTQKQLEDLKTEDPAFYEKVKDQPVLELVIEQVLNSPDYEEKLKAYMDKHGIAAEKKGKLIEEIRDGIVAGAERGGVKPVHEWNDKTRNWDGALKYHVAYIDPDVAKDVAGRGFGVELDDPEFMISPLDRQNIEKIFGQLPPFESTRMAGNFAWEMAEQIGYHTKMAPDKFPFASAPVGAHDSFFDEKGLPKFDHFDPKAADFMKFVHGETQGLINTLREKGPHNLTQQFSKDNLPEGLKHHAGKTGQAIIGEIMAARISDKYGGDLAISDKLGWKGMKKSGEFFTEVSPTSDAIFDVRGKFENLKIDDRGKITGFPGGASIQLAAPDKDGIPVYNIAPFNPLTADGKVTAANWDLMEHMSMEDIKHVIGDKPFSLTFLAQPDGKNAAGWVIQTQETAPNKPIRMYLGPGERGGIREPDLDPSIKEGRKVDATPDAKPDPNIAYHYSRTNKPWEQGAALDMASGG